MTRRRTNPPPDPGCPAAVHSMWATRHGCRCPWALDAIRACHRERSRLTYIPGRRSHNLSGRRRGLDSVAVERAVSGDRSLVLSVPERAAAIAVLRDRERLTTVQIAHRLGVSIRTVDRHLARLRATTSPSTTPQEASA